ncbi:family 43 glycosylhydrolase [Mycetocola sp. 2940]|uniref:glycoside hydrolase family 43 protein n=1 Tax=Mycetocola sp. 2940 TaxID=3156452 RepID=UPI00339492BB
MTTIDVSRLAATDLATVSASIRPIIPGFHPDPSICRVGEDYYLVNSSFEYSPGVPLWHSRDLLEWDLVGNILSGDEHFVAGSAGASGGVYAPTIRHYDGRFWMITTDVSGAKAGQLITSATDPAGPWEPSHTITGLPGIDPDLAWAEDGTCYITYCSNDPALPGIAQARIDLETFELLSTPRVVWAGTGMAHPEGPHLYRHGSWWYLLIAEGGTERGHSVSIARSASPEGPFEATPANPIFTHRSTQHRVQNAGHADLVELPDGSWAAVYLGVRPRGATPSFHVNGRETFLAGIDWVDGWPTFDENRYSVPASDWSFVDRFELPALHARWVSPAARLEEIVSIEPGGGVTLRPNDSGPGRTSMLATRIRDEFWTFEAPVTSGDAALLVRMDERHWFEVRLIGGRAEAILRVGPLTSPVGDPIDVGPGAVTLRVLSLPSLTNGPDDLEAGVVTPSGFTSLGRVDGRYLSTEVTGGFTGRVVGVRALGGTATIESLRYAAYDPDAR